MKPLATVTTLAVLLPSLPALAGDTPGPETGDVAVARDLIASMAERYRTAETLEDEVALEVMFNGQVVQEMSIDLAFAGEDVRLKTVGLELVRDDGTVYVALDDMPKKYFAAPMSGPVVPGVAELFAKMGRRFSMPVPHFAMRGDADVDAVVESMGLGVAADLDVTAFAPGADTHEITLGNERGDEVTVRVGAASSLLTGITAVTRDPGSGAAVTIESTFEPDMTTTPEIAFAAGDRRRVSKVDRFRPWLDEPAVDFDLQTLEGGPTIALDDLRGKVVVLDFWATWCGPCRRGLPLLNEFANWAAEEELPVVVYGLNTLEREPTAEKKIEAARQYWQSQQYDFPSLVDVSDGVFAAYGLRGIPQTVIIDQEGRVFEIHGGFDPGMVSKLKDDVRRALAPAG